MTFSLEYGIIILYPDIPIHTMILEVVMMMTYIIDGNSFSNLEGFFDEIDIIMTKGISFKTGHNLNAFRDILFGDYHGAY